MKNRHYLLISVILLAARGQLSATVTAIDYATGFSSYTQVITTDQPYGLITGDPGSGVTFLNPYFSQHGDLENYDNTNFGGPVTVVLPGYATLFGLYGSINSDGSSMMTVDFYDGAVLVNSAGFVLPAGSPSAQVAAAFSSDTPFDSVVLTAPSEGFMRIGGDSIRSNAVPEPSALALLGLGGLACALRRRK